MHTKETKNRLWRLRSHSLKVTTQKLINRYSGQLLVKLWNPYTNRQVSIRIRIKRGLNSLVSNLMIILAKKKVYCPKESFLVNNVVGYIPGKKFWSWLYVFGNVFYYTILVKIESVDLMELDDYQQNEQVWKFWWLQNNKGLERIWGDGGVGICLHT